MKTQRFSGFKLLTKLVLYIGIAWLIGFSLFWIRLPYAPQGNIPPVEKTDAIVVLTGGPDRIETGISLLEAGITKRMMISGVHKDVLPTELSVLTGARSALFDCCIELGYSASDTIGNAQETKAWVTDNQFKHIVVVTSDYHMQRSLILFKQQMPNITLVAAPVPSDTPPLKLAHEFNKYLVTLVRSGFNI